MTSRDSPQVLRINASGRPGVAPLNDEELARLLALPNEHLVATTHADSALGYILAFHRAASYDGEEFLILRSAIAEPFIYIDQVAVASDHKGRGLGRALYEELESIAGEQTIPFLCCEVNTKPSNSHSLTFHKKLGFESFASVATSDGREVELLIKALGTDHERPCQAPRAREREIRASAVDVSHTPGNPNINHD